MVLRGTRSSRGNGRGRGRGRGRGKTQLWEWESYSPGPEVYDQLWRVRKEPAIVTAHPPDDCPMAPARTRILDRRQTEGPIVRNYYVVEIVHRDERQETEEVDLSRILHYVSAAELERFENEQFRLEAEAEAIAVRAKIEELGRRRLEKNGRGSRPAGRGSRMLSGLGLPLETQIRTRGRPRGRRGRGRGGVRDLGVRDDGTGERLVDNTTFPVLHHEDEEAERVILETEEEEEEEDKGTQRTSKSSPGLMRSAFVANSALPVSPVERRLSTSLARQHLVDEDELPIPFLQDDDIQEHDETPRRIKRPRITSPDPVQHTPIPMEAFTQALLFSDRSSAIESSPNTATGGFTHLPAEQLTLGSSPPAAESLNAEDEESIPADPPVAATSIPHSHPHHYHDQAPNRGPLSSDTIDMTTDPFHKSDEEDQEESSQHDDDDTQEYVVEAIIEHFIEHGKTYYLVKWEGYEDSHDWLAEEDLQGAAELLAEYNAKNRKRMKKEGKVVPFFQ